MNNLKDCAEEQTKEDCGQAINAATTESVNKEYRPSLHDRVRAQLHTIKQEEKRLKKLEELNYLLSKYPDIAKILDLIDEVRY